MKATRSTCEKAIMLSRIEWDMESHLDPVPDWQLVAMLNYEYARCFKPLLEEVAELRLNELPPWNIADRKPTRRGRRIGATMAPKIKNDLPKTPIFDFAYYLACVFPEFPRMPWAEIPPDVRQKRLADININEKTGLYRTEITPAWKAWEMGNKGVPLAMRDLSKPTNYFTEQYGVFEINFKHDDPAIIAKFSDWLKERRKHLIKIWDYPVVGYPVRADIPPAIVFNQNSQFIPVKEPAPERGRGNIKVRCKDLLKDLGWVRIWCHADHDSEKASEGPWPEVTVSEKPEKSTSKEENSQDLYDYFTEPQNIKRAELRVGETMTCLECEWSCGPSFSYFPMMTDHSLAGGGKRGYPSGGEAKKARIELKENFTVTTLKTELVPKTTGQKRFYSCR